MVYILNLQLPAQPNYVYLFSAIDARLVETIITKGIQSYVMLYTFPSIRDELSMRMMRSFSSMNNKLFSFGSI